VTLKEQIERDVAEVFHNTDEFAEIRRVAYGEITKDIPVILDHEITTERKTPNGDNAQGVFLVDVRAYINRADLGAVPRKGKRIKIGAREYKIAWVGAEAGELILDLEAYGE
jgi:hypothetical protein